MKFYCSVRLDVRRIGKVALGETTVGNRTRVKVVKNKCAQPFTEAEFDIRWGTGIDALSDLLDMACELEIIEKNGSHYVFDSKSFANGREKAREALTAQPTLASAIIQQTLVALPWNAPPGASRAA